MGGEKIPDDLSNLNETPKDLDATLQSADETVLDALNEAIDLGTGLKNIMDPDEGEQQ